MSGRTLALTRALIERESVTPDDRGCQDLLAARLAPLGFRCETLAFGKVTNLWARRGSDGPLLCFAGHTDVVPTGPVGAWHSPPFVPSERDGNLYGRGAADMKASLAAMVVACEDFVAARPDHRGSLALLLTSDEEGPAVDGTKKVVEALTNRGESIDYCVVGEPSSRDALGDTLRVGRRGSLNATLTVHGKQGHVAFPDKADNPIHRAAPAIAELCTTRWDEGNASFPPTGFQVSSVQAGAGAVNVIPGSLVVQFNFRFSTEHSEDTLRERVAGILRRHALDYAIDWTLSGNPFVTRSGALIAATVAAVCAETGREPALSTGGGTSDGRFIAPAGAEVVELGPLNASIHQVDENVRIADLPVLTRMYRGVMERLLTTS